MKKLYYNNWERQSIYLNTSIGNVMLFKLECKKLCREVYRKIEPIMKKIFV